MRKRSRWTCLPLTAVAAFAWLTAGAQAQTAPASCGGKLRPMTVGVSVIPPLVVHTTPYVAKELGIFAKHCLDVNILAFEGGSSATAMAAVSQGRAVASLGHVAIGRGMKAKQFWGLAPRLPQVYIVSETVKTPADLKGKRLSAAGGGVGGFNWTMGREVLTRNGMTEADVQFIPGALSGLVPGVITGQLDAFAGHPEDFYLVREKRPGARALVAFAELLPDWVYNMYGASDEFIARNRDLLVDFTAAMTETNRTIFREKDKVIPIMVKATEKPQAAVELSWEQQTRDCVWSVNSGLDKQRMQWSIENSIRNGDLEEAKKPTYEQVVDESIARDALAKLGGPVKIGNCTL